MNTDDALGSCGIDAPLPVNTCCVLSVMMVHHHGFRL